MTHHTCIRDDINLAEIAGLRARPSWARMIVGQPDEIAAWKTGGGLDRYFSDGCVDGCAILVDTGLDGEMSRFMDDQLVQWIDQPDEQGRTPAWWLAQGADMVVARYEMEAGQALWVLADVGGMGVAQLLCDVLATGEEIEVYRADHMELAEHSKVVGEGGCERVWAAIQAIEKKTPGAPRP